MLQSGNGEVRLHAYPLHPSIFYIVLKGVIEEQLKVCASSLQGRIGTSIETLLDIIECDRILYDLVIVPIQLTRRHRLKTKASWRPLESEKQ